MQKAGAVTDKFPGRNKFALMHKNFIRYLNSQKRGQKDEESSSSTIPPLQPQLINIAQGVSIFNPEHTGKTKRGGEPVLHDQTVSRGQSNGGSSPQPALRPSRAPFVKKRKEHTAYKRAYYKN